jgi:hypothetical protein
MVTSNPLFVLETSSLPVVRNLTSVNGKVEVLDRLIEVGKLTVCPSPVNI